MKAAVLHNFGETPRYEDFPDPTPQEGELLIQVKAVALENIDKMMAEGKHFASRQFLSSFPAIVGFDGIGVLEDGRLVGFGGVKAPYGAMADKTVIPKGYTVPIPDGVDAVTAAALPASALTSFFPLKWGAKLQAGETVLINGADQRRDRRIRQTHGANRQDARRGSDHRHRAQPRLNAAGDQLWRRRRDRSPAAR